MGASKKDFEEKREYQHLKEQGQVISNAEYTDLILNKTKEPKKVETLKEPKTVNIKEIANTCNVDIKQAKELTLGLNPFIEERALLIEEFAKVSKLEITKDNIKLFRLLRMKFQKNRTQGTNLWHKTAKEIPLRMGQLIDAIKRNENKINETHESFLEKSEKHFENLEKEKIAKLQIERENELTDLGIESIPFELGEMSVEVWDNYILGVKLAKEHKEKDEKQAEETRLETEKAEKERIEKIESENKRLEKEAKEKELLAKAEQAKRNKEEAEKLEIIQLEAQKLAETKAIEQAVLNAQIQKERLAKEKLEKEIQAKKDAELKELQAKEAKEKALLLAPDKDKLTELANDFLSYPLPKLESDEANIILDHIKQTIFNMSDFIEIESKKL